MNDTLDHRAIQLSHMPHTALAMFASQMEAERDIYKNLLQEVNGRLDKLAQMVAGEI